MRQNESPLSPMVKIAHHLHINVPLSKGGGKCGVKNTPVVPSISDKGLSACIPVYIDGPLSVKTTHFTHRAKEATDDQGLSPFSTVCKYYWSVYFESVSHCVTELRNSFLSATQGAGTAGTAHAIRFKFVNEFIDSFRGGQN